jgi:hypothetical protein
VHEPVVEAAGWVVNANISPEIPIARKRRPSIAPNPSAPHVRSLTGVAIATSAEPAVAWPA